MELLSCLPSRNTLEFESIQTVPAGKGVSVSCFVEFLFVLFASVAVAQVALFVSAVIAVFDVRSLLGRALTIEKLQCIQSMAIDWALLCVLEDKLHRLKTLLENRNYKGRHITINRFVTKDEHEEHKNKTMTTMTTMTIAVEEIEFVAAARKDSFGCCWTSWSETLEFWWC